MRAGSQPYKYTTLGKVIYYRRVSELSRPSRPWWDRLGTLERGAPPHVHAPPHFPVEGLCPLLSRRVPVAAHLGSFALLALERLFRFALMPAAKSRPRTLLIGPLSAFGDTATVTVAHCPARGAMPRQLEPPVGGRPWLPTSLRQWEDGPAAPLGAVSGQLHPQLRTSLQVWPKAHRLSSWMGRTTCQQLE